MPNSTCKSVWNFVVVIILGYTATYMPYKTCFIDNDTIFGALVDWLVDILFVSDIFVQFISAFENKDGTIETNLKTIASDYV